jgi:hypothetical protein
LRTSRSHEEGALTFVTSPTELTTAATDLVLAALAFSGAVYLHRALASPLRAGLWVAFLVVVGVAALAGAVHHGLVLGSTLHAGLWASVLAGLSLGSALVPVAALLERHGGASARTALPWLIGAGALCFAASLWAGLPVLIVFAAACTLYGLALLVAVRRRGAGLIATSLVVSLAASGVQAHGRLAFHLVWPFDHNGIAHLIQVVGLLLLLVGVRRLDGSAVATPVGRAPG